MTHSRGLLLPGTPYCPQAATFPKNLQLRKHRTLPNDLIKTPLAHFSHTRS